jgi:hypothetical protein
VGGTQVTIVAVLETEAGHLHHASARVPVAIHGYPSLDHAECAVGQERGAQMPEGAPRIAEEHVPAELPGGHGLAAGPGGRRRGHVAAADAPGCFPVEAEPDPGVQLPVIVRPALERQESLAGVGPLEALHVEGEGAPPAFEDVDLPGDVGPPVPDGHEDGAAVRVHRVAGDDAGHERRRRLDAVPGPRPVGGRRLGAQHLDEGVDERQEPAAHGDVPRLTPKVPAALRVRPHRHPCRLRVEQGDARAVLRRQHRQDLAAAGGEGPRVRVLGLDASDRVVAGAGVQASIGVRVEVVLTDPVDAVASLPVVHHKVEVLSRRATSAATDQWQLGHAKFRQRRPARHVMFLLSLWPPPGLSGSSPCDSMRGRFDIPGCFLSRSPPCSLRAPCDPVACARRIRFKQSWKARMICIYNQIWSIM